MNKLKWVLVAFTLSSALSALPINYRSLPTANLNELAGANRSNNSFAESDFNFMNGDDFSFASGFTYRVNAITIYSVASILNDALGNEFSQVTLFGRKEGDILAQLSTGTPGTSFTGPLVTNSNPNIVHRLVTYSNGENYEATGAPGLFFPIWATTFSNLNWIIEGGALYEYAIRGVGVAPDPFSFFGYWFNHASNSQLSGSSQTGADGIIRVFSTVDMMAASAETDPVAAGLWDKGADMNITMNVDRLGAAIPEPGTSALAALGLLAAGFASRRRRGA